MGVFDKFCRKEQDKSAKKLTEQQLAILNKTDSIVDTVEYDLFTRMFGNIKCHTQYGLLYIYYQNDLILCEAIYLHKEIKLLADKVNNIIDNKNQNRENAIINQFLKEEVK